MAGTDDPSEVDDGNPARRTVDLCRSHAGDLLRAAKRVLNDEGLPHLAYHFATLALEEVGKAGFLQVRALIEDTRDTSWINKRLDDHEAKIFWALWTPGFGRTGMSKEQFEAIRSTAKRVHQNRLGGLYVSSDPSAPAPNEVVTRQDAETLIGLVEARLGLEVSREALITIDDDLKWLMTATDDPEKFRLIFGSKSLERLAEMKGDTRAWVAWVRAEFDKADADAQELVRREMNRVKPSEAEADIPKWRVRIRLHTPSHSIRPKALKRWNDMFHQVKLVPVDKKKDQLIVELTWGRWVSAGRIYSISWGMARHVATALSIGSLGFFWWGKLEDPDEFYEDIVDLEQTIRTEVQVKPSPNLSVGWGQKPLQEIDAVNSALVWALIGTLGDAVSNQVFGPYIGGLIFISKTDLHLPFVFDAGASFAEALTNGLVSFRDFDGNRKHWKPS